MVPSFETLPVETFHRIFDNLDSETIFFSIRPVCRLFRSVANTYNGYVLDFKSISKSRFYLFSRLMHPRNVISLTLSNDERTSNQIGLFISLVCLRQFARLRSLIFVNVDEGQLNFMLERIKLNRITSFSCNIRKYEDRHETSTLALLSSAIASSTLCSLELGIEHQRISKIVWPMNCTIQYLTITNYITTERFCTILQNSPHLHTLNIRTVPTAINETLSSICFPQLTSLTINNLSVTIDELEPFLLLTPSLVYLKLIGGKKMMDGKRWEQFIPINLPNLDKFEFYFTEYPSLKQTATHVELTIASFQTPFWSEHKKWFITCECNIEESHSIDLYSIPICKPDMFYSPKSKKISLSSSPMMMNNDQLIMNNIKSLTLTWNKSVADDTEQQVCYQSKSLLFY